MNTLHRRKLLRLAALGAAAASPLASTSITSADWKQGWQKIVTAAEKEGALSLLTWGDTWGGVGYSAVIDRFQQAFPGITVKWLPESSADTWLAIARRERQEETYSFDLALVQPDAALTEGAREGLWGPLEPLLFHAGVRDDDAWRDGFAARFLDAGGNSCFSWEYQVIHAYSINTDLVRPGEITSVKDLAAPKWTAKVISSDPHGGLGLSSAAAVASSWGTDMLRRLLVDQQPAIVEDAQELVESLVLGKHPIALGVRPKALQEFQETHPGLGNNVTYLDLPDADFAVTTPLLLFDRAPHPAAATLFANWILTQEGQTILTRSLPTNSARTDVEPFVSEGIATAGKAYYEPDREANYAHTAKTQLFIEDLLVGA